MTEPIKTTAYWHKRFVEIKDPHKEEVVRFYFDQLYINMDAVLEMRDHIRLLELEVERCHHNEDLENENNLQFDKWVDEFLIANGLEKYIDPLHDYLSEKVSNDGDEA
jgi:hypothetical protein